MRQALAHMAPDLFEFYPNQSVTDEQFIRFLECNIIVIKVYNLR